MGQIENIALAAGSRVLVEELVYSTAMRMDEKDFAGYLALCDASYKYRITAYSPEIRKLMTWLEHDHKGMKLLFDNLPKHNSDQSMLSRHVTLYKHLPPATWTSSHSPPTPTTSGPALMPALWFRTGAPCWWIPVLIKTRRGVFSNM